MDDPLIGAGWAFPLSTDATGTVVLSRGETKIEESIWLILGTAYGEREMRPEFGCGIHDLVFAPGDARTRGIAAREVRASLLRWEPRIEVRSVDVVPDPDDSSILLIDIGYVIRATNDPRNLVFPFYVIPETGER